MRVLNKVLAAAAACVLVTIAGGEARAFSKIVVFGDSLSDNGNVYRLTQGFSSNPLLPFPDDATYVGGRQTNGRVAVEFMALHMHTPLVDFAQAGATTGTANTNDDGTYAPAGTLKLAGMSTQVANYLPGPHPVVDPNALYVLWGGPNDFLSGLANPIGFDPALAIGTALGNLSSEAQSLYGAGARSFLIPNMPDLGLTPRASFGGVSAQATALTEAFDANLNNMLVGLRVGLPGSTIFGFDSLALSRQIFAELSGGDPHALNVTVPCSLLTACATDPATQSQFFFWDEIHPTTQVASIFGSNLAQAVPEPETWAALIAGLALLAWMRRRIRN